MRRLKEGLVGKIAWALISAGVLISISGCSMSAGLTDLESVLGAEHPVISASCAASVAEDSAYSCAPVVSSDPDPANTPTWLLASANTCSWATIDPVSGAVGGTPDNSHVGSCTLAFKENNGTADSNTLSFPVSVGNSAPVLAIADVGFVLQDSAAAIIRVDAAIQASDEGQGSTTYSFDHATTSGTRCFDHAILLTIDPSTGAVTYQPEANYKGNCDIKVAFDDGNGGSASAQFLIRVAASLDENPSAPTLAFTTCPATATVGVAYSCEVTVSDPETTVGDAAFVETTPTGDYCGSWLTVSGSGTHFTLTGTPSAVDMGTCTLAVHAKDALNNRSPTLLQSVVVSATGGWTTQGILTLTAPLEGFFKSIGKSGPSELTIAGSFGGFYRIFRFDTASNTYAPAGEFPMNQNYDIEVSPLGAIYSRLFSGSALNGFGVYASYTGGSSWSVVDRYTYDPAYNTFTTGLATLSNDHVFLITRTYTMATSKYSSALRRSTDMGANWEDVPLPTGFTVYGYGRGPSGELYLAGYLSTDSSTALLYKSTDDGTTFTTVDSAVVSGGGGVWYSNGDAYKAVSVTGNRVVWGVPYYAYDPGYRIAFKVRSSDANGANFAQIDEYSSPPYTWLEKILHDSNGNLYVRYSTQSGSFLRFSADHSTFSNKTTAKGGIETLGTAVFIAGDQATSGLYGNYRQPVLYKSTDGGSSWTSFAYSGPSQAISTVRPMEAIVSATDGSLFMTAEQRLSSANPSMASAGLFRSTDDGQTWTTLKDGYRANPNDSTMMWSIAEDPATGDLYWAGTYGSSPPSIVVQKSTDRGATWTTVLTRTGTPAAGWTPTVKISVPAASKIVLGYNPSYGSTVITVSDDGGATWTDKLNTAKYFYYLATQGSSKIAAVLETLLYVSVDGGSSWRTYDTGAYLRTVSFDSLGNVYAGGTSGKIYRSIDGGQSWALQTIGSNLGVSAMSVFSNGVIYVAGTEYEDRSSAALYRLSSWGSTAALVDGIVENRRGSGYVPFVGILRSQASGRVLGVGGASSGGEIRPITRISPAGETVP